MATINNKKKNNQADKYACEHNKIMKMSETIIINVEWSKIGDYFQKFSLYDDCTPVKTSSETTLIS
jgi:hypothetical protein